MTIRVEKQAAVTTIINHRPEARNAMDPDSADALVEAFTEFERDPDAKVAVLYGEGGAFCAGWDLKYGHTLKGKHPLAHLDFTESPDNTPRGPLGPTRMALSKPVIAAVAGPAVAGGMELALWCDIRVMEEDAYFGVYCRRWGIPLLDGGTVRLPRLVGQGRAMEIILTGRQVLAEECLRIGACERVVAKGTSRIEAESLAREITQFPFQCVLADRRSIYAQHGKSVHDAMQAEWGNGLDVLEQEGIPGAGQFVDGHGRHGEF
ncbi:MAG: putative enoyl-coa hydratase/isomerase [marine bacterium B5-7]|nr:MAG: putative enoyl-coa hydratase/isomerase [marine bacterium B5-7]